MSRVTPDQIRAGRAFTGWTMAELARVAGVSIVTIKRMEDSSGAVVGDAVGGIVDALETEGVRFLQDDGDGPGVRFRRR